MTAPSNQIDLVALQFYFYSLLLKNTAYLGSLRRTRFMDHSSFCGTDHVTFLNKTTYQH